MLVIMLAATTAMNNGNDNTDGIYSCYVTDNENNGVANNIEKQTNRMIKAMT